MPRRIKMLLISLSTYRQHADADHQFATLLNDIRPQSLELFEMFSSSQIGAESFLALNCHRESLKELKLNDIKAEAIPAISMMRGCTSLTCLMMAENERATQDLEKSHFLETVAWLTQCKDLKTISISKMLSAPALLTPILLENNIRLTSLELDCYEAREGYGSGYLMSKSRDFHQALACQTTLQSLWLNGESSDLGLDVDILVDSISKLENLTDLRLRFISDYFSNQHIRHLAKSLPKLETWWTHGWAVTDAIWRDIKPLKHLRRLDFNANTRFTANGILNLIMELGPGNHGFELSINKADMDFDLSEEEQTMIREALKSQVDGRFDFALVRGK